MSNRTPTTVESWEELQERMTSIVADLNANPALGLAAAANPFEALEELGYRVEAHARREIEDRLRFPPAEAARRKELREQIYREAGREFDPDSAEELRRVLYDELEITGYPDERGCYPDPPDPRRPRKRLGGEPEPDPLGALEGRHPILEPLLEYRQLDARHAPFASPGEYAAIRSGEIQTGIRGLRIRLKGGAGGRAAGRSDRGSRAGSRRRGEGNGPKRLNINTATAAELAALPGIGGRLAGRIVEHRDEHGRFESLDELRNVPGISGQLLTKLRPHITTES